MSATESVSDAEAVIPADKGQPQNMARVLAEMTSMCPVPFVRASTTDPVIDVVGELVDVGRGVAALVFDDDDGGRFAGIFTERDYLKVTVAQSTGALEECSVEGGEAACESLGLDPAEAGLFSTVGAWMTPAEKIVTAGPETTADEALALLRAKAIRHLVITSGDDIQDAQQLLGVVSVNQIVGLLQSDDRQRVNSLALQDMSSLLGGDTADSVRKTMATLRERQVELLNKQAELQGEEDLKRTGLVVLGAVVAGLVYQGTWLEEHWQAGLWATFVLGYAGIILEEVVEFNKAAVALLMSGLTWVIYSDFSQGAPGEAPPEVLAQLGEKLAEVSDICFFILAASTIVEVMDAHQGFRVITKFLETNDKRELFVKISVLTFFLSAILNNLTVTIVMVSLLRKLVPDVEERKLFGALVVVAANAGGVWTPIGDVTTTMLWINENLSTGAIVTNLIFPSLVCLAVSTAVLLPQIKETTPEEVAAAEAAALIKPEEALAPRGNIVFGTGIAALLSVPIFNELTGLPPYLGMLAGLGALWLLTDVIHAGEKRDGLRVPASLEKLDTSGILFFFGVLLSVGALESSGLLKDLAVFLSDKIGNLDIIAAVIGLASAVVDNVPLVAAAMGMYDLSEFPTDDPLWQLIAYCAGTGGSILIIGSASGVALMGLEKIEFLWYTKKVSLAALAGYGAGIVAYLGQVAVLSGLS